MAYICNRGTSRDLSRETSERIDNYFHALGDLNYVGFEFRGGDSITVVYENGRREASISGILRASESDAFKRIMLSRGLMAGKKMR